MTNEQTELPKPSEGGDSAKPRAKRAQADHSAREAAEPAPKRRRGRPRKNPLPEEAANQSHHAEEKAQQAGSPAQDKGEQPKRRRGRPRKNPLLEEAPRPTQAIAKMPTESTGLPARTLADASARQQQGSQPAPERQDRASGDHQFDQEGRRGFSPRQQRFPGDRGSRQQRGSFNQQGQRGFAHPAPFSQQGDRNQQVAGKQGFRYQQNGQQRSQQFGQGNRRHNNNVGRRGQLAEPKLSREELSQMLVAELRSHAAELGVEYVGVRKAQLVEAVYVAAARAEGFRSVAGVLDIVSEGYGFVRTGNYMPGENDAFVPQQLIKHLGLRRGDWVEGSVRPSRPNDKYPALQKVTAVNGLDPDALRYRARFRDLTPVYPNERLTMEHGRDSITGRAIDLVAPIGKGQRGLIVSPPKAGKTTVLKRVCESIVANNPEVHLICLLVDERPEEVTDMQRSIKGDVVASTFDMPAENHTAVSELVIERAKRLVEMGRDVVVVLDSITRLARAYNLAQPASGRILSGGVDSAALYPPKRFLGAARNIENGGSLTILASALIDTGSKMDEVIFEEFKGTGNMELKLDRELADKRIFPAIDPVASGTRNEDLLVDANMRPFVWGIRRILANMNNTERAAASFIKGLKGTNSNQEFLIRTAKKAADHEASL